MAINSLFSRAFRRNQKCSYFSTDNFLNEARAFYSFKPLIIASIVKTTVINKEGEPETQYIASMVGSLDIDNFLFLKEMDFSFYEIKPFHFYIRHVQLSIEIESVKKKFFSLTWS
jgi:hypothetical protein